MSDPQEASWTLWGGKFATTRELLGQISFLVNKEHELNAEIAKYQSYVRYHLPFAETALKQAQDNLTQLEEQIQYYTDLLNQYKQKGLAV